MSITPKPPEIIPYLFYRDVGAALDFLARTFGFKEEMRAGTPSGGMHGEASMSPFTGHLAGCPRRTPGRARCARGPGTARRPPGLSWTCSSSSAISRHSSSVPCSRIFTQHLPAPQSEPATAVRSGPAQGPR